MKAFRKTALAVAFSLIGVVSSVSALAMATNEQNNVVETHEIEVIADDSDTVKIFASNDGDVTNVSLPKSALQDKEQLAAALVDVPEDLREKLLHSLGNINFDDNVIKIIKAEGHDNAMSWSSDSDSEQVFVIELDDDNSNTEIVSQMIKKFSHGDVEKVIEFKHGAGMSVDSVIRLLEHGKYSVDDLNKIQQALDAKR